MSDPRSPARAESEIWRLSAELEVQTSRLTEATQRWADREYLYKIAWANAYLRASGTVAEREARATLAVASELRDRGTAEAAMKAAQEAGRNLRAQLDALRSINVNLRAAIDWSRGEGG